MRVETTARALFIREEKKCAECSKYVLRRNMGWKKKSEHISHLVCRQCMTSK